MQSWSLGILCYNEAGTIQQVIKDSERILQKIAGNDYEIIVVDDCSADGSYELINECVKQIPKVKMVHHEVNKGIGEALRSIYFNATKENVVAICGDNQFDVNELLETPAFERNEFVAFYRLQNTEYNGFRNMLSFFNKWFNRYFLSISLKDVNWVKAYKSDIVKSLNLELKSSLVESEICSKLIQAGATPKEYKSKYLPRTYGSSKGSSFKIVLKAISDLWKLYRVVKKYTRKYGTQLSLMLR